jgi:hypothetical protein
MIVGMWLARLCLLVVLAAVVAPVEELRAAEPLRVFSLTQEFIDGEPSPQEGAAAATVEFPTGDLVALPDGSFLVTGYGTVWRVERTGRLSRVAGTQRVSRRRRGSGDGGPARLASLYGPRDIAVAGDGSLLIADACSVRRVTPDGRIETVAGQPYDPSPSRGYDCNLVASAECGSLGDGGPATAAKLVGPTGVTPTPDGGFLIADPEDGRVRRVAPEGTITTAVGRRRNSYGCGGTEVLPTREPSKVAATSDGGFLMTDREGVWRVAADGTTSRFVSAPGAGLSEDGTVFFTRGRPPRLRILGQGGLSLTIGGARSRFFDGFGDTVRSVAFPLDWTASDVELTPDGVLIDAYRLLLAARPRPSRLAVAIGPESLSALLRHKLSVRTTRSAKLRIDVLRDGSRRAHRVIQGRPGLNRVRLPMSLSPGAYLVRIRATTPAGSVATDSLQVLIGGVLPRDVASSALASDYPEEDETEIASATPCRRFSPRRIDCIVGFEGSDSWDDCAYIGSARLRPDGQLYVATYPCRKRRFRRRPGPRTRFHQAPPLSEFLPQR